MGRPEPFELRVVLTATRFRMKDSCLKCMSDTDCMSTSECLPAKCDTSTGMCSIGTPKPLKTECSSNGEGV